MLRINLYYVVGIIPLNLKTTFQIRGNIVASENKIRSIIKITLFKVIVNLVNNDYGVVT